MTLQATRKSINGRRFKTIADYKGIANDGVLTEIGEKAQQLQHATMVHVNATNYGGGVAEILDNFVLLMNDLGIRTDWRVLHGTPEFFEVTKKFHNALQGKEVEFSQEELDLYEFTNSKFARFAFLDHEFVIIHDPQPCGLGRYVPHVRPWVWRCHIDLTQPSTQAWEFLKPFIEEYERMIVSSEGYKNGSLTVPQQIIHPSIDPISPKNMELSEEVIEECLHAFQVPTDKPIITQVSRFDPWKDPVGVLKVYDRVREQTDCRLVFCYNMASDDPEGVRIYDQMLNEAETYLERGEVLFVRGDDPILVNALQAGSDVVLQKSTREGFGLTVTEAMWKRTPVVASNVGGIPLQILDQETGFLVDPEDYDEVADRVVRLLEDPDLAARIGHQAQEHVREHFLITRHILDYLNLMLGI